ncbi:MAG: apolipoprotein N-acyltransferase [Clostridia bacterium]|nr:apolipoprotein N-acyltransferase [Clostridia bacterium]
MFKTQKEPFMLDLIIKLRWPLLLIGAALMGLVVIFPTLGFLQWSVLIPAMAVILSRLTDPKVKFRHMYGMGFCFFAVYFTIAWHWFLWMYPLDYAGLSNAASAAVVALGSLGMGAFQAASAAFIFPLFGLACRSKYLSRLPLLHPLLFAAMWTVLEWFQAHSGWSGVPWGRLPLGQAETVLMLQSASLFGSYFITFLLVAINGLLAYGFIYTHRRTVAAAISVAMILSNFFFGVIYAAIPVKADSTVKVASIQGNLASGEEWGALGSVGRALDTYGELTRQAAAEGAEIVLWPETAIVSDLKYVKDDLTELAVECQVTILTGIFTDSPNGESDYNSVVAILPDGTVSESEYHKRNLVPFGEFVPLRDLIMTVAPFLTEINTLDSDFSFGTEATVIPLEQGNVGPLICFDSIYEDNARESVQNGAQLLAIPTNDSWFKDSRGVWMHSAQAQLRAIETGRYVMRAANTGVSSIINHKGEVLDFLGTFETGYVIQEVEMLSGTTLYSVIGNLFVYLCMAFAAGCVLFPLGECAADGIKASKKAK